jgi:capsular exopolysaccharide synthesis family protein
MGYIFEALQKAAPPGTPPAAANAAAPGSAAPAAPAAASPVPAPQSAPAPAAAPPSPTPAVAPARPAWSERILADSTADLDERLVMLTSPGSAAAEEFRAIRARLAAAAGRPGIFTITSAAPGEGRTVTALNLAAAFAEVSQSTTVVVEADLRRPAFRRMLGWPEAPGLAHVLQNACSLDEALRPLKSPRLLVLHTGFELGAAASELLGSPRFRELIATLRQRFENVVIDTPAVLEFADAGLIGAQSDHVLLAVRANRTPRPLVDRAIQTLQSYRARVAGVVLTEAEAPRRGWRHL